VDYAAEGSVVMVIPVVLSAGSHTPKGQLE
jgi:hypothetical protein